jgi:hypothetical protein
VAGFFVKLFAVRCALFALRYSQIKQTIVDRTHYEKAESRKLQAASRSYTQWRKGNILQLPMLFIIYTLFAVRFALLADHTHNCGSHSLWESRKLQAASGKQSRHTMEKKQYFIIAHAIHYIHAVRCALLAVRRSYT